MKRYLLILLSVIIIYTFTGCSNIWPDVQNNYHDNTLISLHKQVNNIQDAYDFSSKRVNDWGAMALKLHRIVIYFTGEQIQTQHGTMEYIFVVDDGKNNYLAEAIVTVDMKSGDSTSFDVTFDPRTNSKRNKNGFLEGWSAINKTDFTEWTLTIDEAFSIIYSYLGENTFSQYQKPKITLECFSDQWIFYVTKENDSITSADVNRSIILNPKSKEIIETKGF